MNMAQESESNPTPDARRRLALRLLPLLDLTSLGEDDTPQQIEALCASAQTAHGVPAAVCVYPEHITTADRALRGCGVRIATVVNFPDGSSNRERVLRETRRAIAAGANEIDLVLPSQLDTAADRVAAQQQVAAYLDQTTHKFGESWVTPEHIRIGASRLFGDIFATLAPGSTR